jgi:2-polyprenyl-3-methyl-5-hydroxy-6-metoxy-1,4-benzoquinol methylase
MSATPASSEYQYRTYTTRPEGHHRYLHAPVLRLVSKYIPEGSRILDIGCGNGSLCAQLSGQYQVSGLDLSESGIEAARQLCPAGRFEVATVYDDLADRFGCTFEAAISLEVVEHLYDPHAYLRRIHDAVAPGGALIVSTPYHGYLKNLVMAVSGKLDDHFHALREGAHIKFWSRATLSRLFDDCGFDVLQFAGCGRYPYLWKSMILVGRRRPD